MARYSFFLMAMLVLLALGCKKKDDDYKSIVGQWIMEDNGDVSAYRRYNVGIESVLSDTAQYAIFNFYRTGNANHVRVEVRDNEILIRSQLVNGYLIQGSGTVDGAFEKINLQYEVRGGTVGYESVMSVLSRP